MSQRSQKLLQMSTAMARSHTLQNVYKEVTTMQPSARSPKTRMTALNTELLLIKTMVATTQTVEGANINGVDFVRGSLLITSINVQQPLVKKFQIKGLCWNDINSFMTGKYFI